MKKLTVLIIALMLAASGLFAQTQAVVKQLSGKVEVKGPGAAVWVPARVGQALAKGSFISTGFNATAVLALGASVLSVKPLTRMKLEELIAREGTVSTSLFLQVGKVNAAVKSAEGLKQDFTVKSPVSTAAVRGTEFEFDGLTVKVINGLVYFSNNLGQSRGVAQGEQSSTTGAAPPTGGDQENRDATAVAPYVGSAGGLSAAGTSAPGTATVIVSW
jgi:hypothetical protein